MRRASIDGRTRSGRRVRVVLGAVCAVAAVALVVLVRPFIGPCAITSTSHALRTLGRHDLNYMTKDSARQYLLNRQGDNDVMVLIADEVERSDDGAYRGELLEVLFMTESVEGRDALRGLVESDDHGVSVAAARLLAERHDPTGRDVLKSALEDARATGDEVMEAALTEALEAINVK